MNDPSVPSSAATAAKSSHEGLEIAQEEGKPRRQQPVYIPIKDNFSWLGAVTSGTGVKET